MGLGAFLFLFLFARALFGVVDFNVMKNDRTDPKAPKRTALTAGRFNGKTGEVFLFDGIKGKFVPAIEHPAIDKGATS